MIFNRAIQRIEENSNKKYNCIPWGLERFEEVLPGIMQRKYYIVTASTGVSKTQFTDEFFMYRPIEFVLNTETDIKVKIFYYSLEVDKESKIIQGIARKLYRDYKMIVPFNRILSMNKSRVSQEEFELIKQTKEYFEKLEDFVYIYDEHINPYGIYKRLHDYAETHGKIVKKKINKKVVTASGKVETHEEEVFDYYVPNNPNEYVIIVVDHISLLSPELGLSIKGTIEKHSNNMITLRNKFGYTAVVVQQQMAAQEELEFHKGRTIESKLIPSLLGLAESKLTGRDADVVLGLFSPSRHEITDFRGYNIGKLQDNYRSLHVLKYRSGSPNGVSSLYFNGAVNQFQELEKADMFSQNPKLYEKYKTT